MAGTSPVPGTPGAAPPPTLAGLVGPAGQPDVTQQQANQQQAAKAVMYQFHDLQAGVEALARQFPAVADQMKQVKQLLVDAMVSVVGTLGSGPEAPGPNVIG